MDGLRAAVLAVCAVSAARCVIGSIVSVTKLKNQVMLLLDMLLALLLITPFVQGISGFTMPELPEFEMPGYVMENDAYTKALEAETEKSISDVLCRQLDAAGINYSFLVTDVNILADYSISISSVTITAEDFEAAALIVKNSLGYETEVIRGENL